MNNFSRIERIAFAVAIVLVVLISWITSAHAEFPQSTRLFHIPAAPLDWAVSQWCKQARFQALDDYSVLAGSDGAAISGLMTPVEALNRLLAPSGLVFYVVNDRTVTIEGIPYCRPWLGQYAPIPPCRPARKVTQL